VAVQKIAAVGEDLKNLGDKISGVGTTLTKGVTTLIVGPGTAAVKIAVDFDSAMSYMARAGWKISDMLSGISWKATSAILLI